MHTDNLHLREIVVFLAAVVLIVPLLHRLRTSPVIGFLLVGLIIGPFGLGRLVADFPWLSVVVIEDVSSIKMLAELGIVFLMFMIGLSLSLDRLIALRRLVFGLGTAQVLVSALAIGLIAMQFGNDVTASIVIGAALALSSTAIVMQLLIENRRLGSATGNVGFSVLLFQDLAVVPILFLVGVLGTQGQGNVAFDLALAVGKAFLVIGIIIALGRVVLRPIFDLVGATKSREMFMAALLLVAIGTAAATSEAGLSLALGAFLAGLLLAETEYRHQIEVDIGPFKGLLLGVFFVSVGMTLDLKLVIDNPWWLLVSVVGLFTLKAIILFGLAKLFAIATPVAFEAAILLGQSGEFAFLVLSQALSRNLIDPSVAQFILITTTISMFLTPGAAWLARRGAATFEEGTASTTSALMPGTDASALSGHVIVAGYGRVGQMLGELLEEQKIVHVALDLDVGIVSGFRRAGVAVYFGDATHADILKRVGVERASALVVTMDDPTAAERVVWAVRRLLPDLPIMARARDRRHAKRLITLGASEVVPETIEASLDLSEVVFAKVGLSAEVAHRIVADRRQREREDLVRDEAASSNS